MKILVSLFNITAASICFVLIFSAPPLLAADAKTIITFGDSITKGFWEHTDPELTGERAGGFQPDLERLLDGVNNHHDVLNYGLGGERTSDTDRRPYPEGGIHRLARILPSVSNAKYILIMEGTNDYWDGIPAHATRDNLRNMITQARSYGIEPIIGTLTPDTRPGTGKDIPSLNELIRTMATEENVLVADFYPQMIDKWDSTYRCLDWDFVHPCRKGYEKMAEIWFRALPGSAAMPWLNLLLKN